jgi:hypothetical protein
MFGKKGKEAPPKVGEPCIECLFWKIEKTVEV